MTVIERMLEKANIWIGDTAAELGWDDREKALHALRAVLHAVRDRLQIDEAVHLGAQLPTVIRGVYYEGWTPRATPLKVRTRAAFLDLVRRPFAPGDPSIDPDAISRAVFRVVTRHVSSGEVADVRQALPRSIEAMWPPSYL